jgi:molybdopterin synthase sulfur carrier subunit
MPPSIKVKVKFFTTLREIVGKKEEQIELSRSVTMEALLRQVSKTYGKEFQDYLYDELGNLRGHLHFLVNGKSITALQGLKTKLREGDQVAILPPVGGG